MSTLLEVKIFDLTLVVACDDQSTVASVTSSAVTEYLSFNLKKFPQKVLFTRDSQGRVLSGNLKIIQNNIDIKLEVVVSDYGNNDTLSPKETECLYREWQLWTANQLKESIHALSFADIPPYPEKVSLVLLYELCDSPQERVQLVCVKALQLLLTKFSQRDLVVQAAERICRLFVRTEYADVAVAALECFRGLSPLQARVFDSARYVREMFDVQRALLRFSADKQSALFRAFASVSAIIGDQELSTVVKALANDTSNAVDGGDGSGEVKVGEEEGDDGDLLTTKEGSEAGQKVPAELRNQQPSSTAISPELSSALPTDSFAGGAATSGLSKNNILITTTAAAAASGAAPKRINLRRLESLLASEDPKVRLYSLEKLLRLLSQAAAAALTAEVTTHPMEVSAPAAVVNAEVQVATGAAPYELQHPNATESAAAPATAIATTPPPPLPPVNHHISPYAFEFSDGREVESIIKCLFTCLKKCIHARPPKRVPGRNASAADAVAAASGANSNAESDAVPAGKLRSGDTADIDSSGGSGAANNITTATGAADTKGNNNNGKGYSLPLQQVTASSTAGKLIQAALQSPQSDEQAVRLAVDCLWHVAHFPVDVKLGALYPARNLLVHRRHRLRMNGAVLTNIQLVFVTAAREWYRLLLTLAHADEGSKLLRYADLAEKSAYFFALVALHGMPGGWLEAEVALEVPALHSFVSAPAPGFRSYLGLSYLASLSASLAQAAASSSAAGDPEHELHSGKHNKPSDSVAILQEAMLAYRGGELARCLWRWGTGGSDRARSGARRSAVLSLECIACCCSAVPSFVNFLHKLDPITRYL